MSIEILHPAQDEFREVTEGSYVNLILSSERVPNL